MSAVAAAFGFRIAGVPGAPWLAVRDCEDWPLLTFARDPELPEAAGVRVDASSLRAIVPGSWSNENILHPGLALGRGGGHRLSGVGRPGRARSAARGRAAGAPRGEARRGPLARRPVAAARPGGAARVRAAAPEALGRPRRERGGARGAHHDSSRARGLGA